MPRVNLNEIIPPVMYPVIRIRRKEIQKFLRTKMEQDFNVYEFGDKFCDDEWVLQRVFGKYFQMFPQKEGYRMIDEALIDAAFEDYKKSHVRARI